MDLILCAWTNVGLLFAVRRAVLANVQGTHVSWAMGALELVWWYVWAAYTPLVIGLAKRFPLTGPRVVLHIAIHTIASLTMAPLASVTEYFLSRGLVQSVFRVTDPGVLHLLPPFTVSVLSMSFTGILTYWVVVGLYQSIPFTRPLWSARLERRNWRHSSPMPADYLRREPWELMSTETRAASRLRGHAVPEAEARRTHNPSSESEPLSDRPGGLLHRRSLQARKVSR